MKKHFVEFFSPGTFFSERSSKEIKSWDVKKAQKMAKKIKERYGAIPYGFQFFTKERTKNDLDSKEVKRSGMYFINCRIRTIQEIRKKADPNERILLSNMENNKWDKVVETVEGWKCTLPFEKEDILL